MLTKLWLGLVKIVLDTNVLVSALITKDTPPDQLYQAWRGWVFDLVTSRDQINELERVLGYKHLEKLILPAEADILLANIDTAALIVDVLPIVNLSPDPNDNQIIATAIAGKADYIVTGDKKDLLALKEAEGISIITARQAVEITDTVKDE